MSSKCLHTCRCSTCGIYLICSCQNVSFVGISMCSACRYFSMFSICSACLYLKRLTYSILIHVGIDLLVVILSFYMSAFLNSILGMRMYMYIFMTNIIYGLTTVPPTAFGTIEFQIDVYRTLKVRNEK